MRGQKVLAFFLILILSIIGVVPISAKKGGLTYEAYKMTREPKKPRIRTTLVISSWLKFPVIFDGKITNPEEWSDTNPVDMTLTEWEGTGETSARVWIKNDDDWLYLLYRIEWPEWDYDSNDGGQISYHNDWDYIPPLWNHSDLGFINQNNDTWDAYGWNETASKWYGDTTAIPPGENNVEGATRYDGTLYWFEFRKELDSGDGYDWSFTPGQVIEPVFEPVPANHLLVSIWDSSAQVGYHEYISLHLSGHSEIYLKLYPNPLSVGEILVLKGVLLTEFSEIISGEDVRIYVRPLSGSWKYITSLTTDTYGRFIWQVEIPVVGVFVIAVYYPGSEIYGSTYSTAILVVQ